MSEIHVTVNGGMYRYGTGTIRIGRSSENDIVINDPTVSRRHAQISWEAEGWVWQNLGQAPTFLGGQPVARFVIAGAVDVTVASPQGPAIRLQSTADGVQQAGQPAGTAPLRTELAGQPQAGPGGYPAAPAAAAGVATGYAAGAAPATAQAGPQDYQGAVGYQGAANYQGAAGYPGGPPAPGYAPVAGPGAPGAPGGPGFAPAGMGYPGFVPGMPQLDVNKLERGSVIENKGAV